MTEKTLKKAVEEAKEFTRRATILLGDKETMLIVHIGYGDKLTGSVRRQSMELSRALSEMRRP
jgi:hypothetical protein